MSSMLLKLSAFSSVLNLGFTPISNMIARIFGYLTILLFLTSVIFSVCKGKEIIINKIVLYFFIVIVVAFITSFQSVSLESIDGLVDSLLAVSGFITFYIALSTEQQENSQFVLEDVYRINNLLCFVLIFFAFGPFDFKYTIANDYGYKIFTLGLGNPNGVALCVMFAIVFSMIQFLNVSKIRIKIMNTLIIIVMFYILYLLSSRTVLFSALFIALAFFFKFPRVFKWVSYISVLTPVLMLLLQLKLGKMNNLTLKILGKSINTGRPDLYKDILEDIMDSPIKILFGDFCSYCFGNTHNGILTIFVTLGIVGVFLYINFWNYQLKVLRKICIKKEEKIAFVTLISVLIHASSESMGVIGTIPYSIFVVIIMKIAKGEIRSKYD